MARKPPNERPSAYELKHGRKPGVGNEICPGCGGVLWAYKTIRQQFQTVRYVRCENPCCARAFITKQSRQEIVREVISKKVSSTGNIELTEPDE